MIPAGIILRKVSWKKYRPEKAVREKKGKNKKLAVSSRLKPMQAFVRGLRSGIRTFSMKACRKEKDARKVSPESNQLESNPTDHSSKRNGKSL